VIEEEDEVPQGIAEEAAINNADIEPAAIVGVAGPRETSIKADNVGENDNEEDDDDSIEEIELPPQPKIEPIDLDEYADDDEGGDEDKFVGRYRKSRSGKPRSAKVSVRWKEDHEQVRRLRAANQHTAKELMSGDNQGRRDVFLGAGRGGRGARGRRRLR
jgi:hypothetical protein